MSAHGEGTGQAKEEVKTATIYIQNLNEKVKLPDLKNSLF